MARKTAEELATTNEDVKVKASRSMALKALRTSFREIPKGLKKTILAMNDLATLEACANKAATCQSMDEFVRWAKANIYERKFCSYCGTSSDADEYESSDPFDQNFCIHCGREFWVDEPVSSDDIYEQYFCSFCGKEFDVDESGTSDENVSIRFQSPFHGCKTLPACDDCRPKFEGKKSDQFFCNFCGKQIGNIERKTIRDEPEAKVIVIQSYSFTTVLICNECQCGEYAELIAECTPCPACKIPVHQNAVPDDDGKCPNCGSYFMCAGEYVVPEMYKD